MRAVVVIAMCAALLPFSARAADSVATRKDTLAAPADTLKTFTAEQLAAYNGKKGQPAYIAVNGVVYDVTTAKDWNKGKHQGYSAGKDVTALMDKSSPHGMKPLGKLKVVGKLVAAPGKEGSQ